MSSNEQNNANEGQSRAGEAGANLTALLERKVREYANAWYGEGPSFDQIINGLTHVIRIAILDEREKCAKECDKWADYWQHLGHEEIKEVAEMCAEDIRMRSND